MSEQLCDQCTQELKDEANFMMQILNTPHVSDYNIELVNEVLYGTLRELYQVEDCDEEEQPVTSGYIFTMPTTEGTVLSYTSGSTASSSVQSK